MSEALERVRAAAPRLKIFPLASAVVLPGGALPLHIFEPRYREMVAHALASDGVFAMAQPMPGQERAPAPALEDIVCAGVVSHTESLPDGRSNLVLVGVARARIIREWPLDKPYREVEAEVLPDASVEATEETALRQAVWELVARLPPEVGQRIAHVTARAHGGLLADVVAAAIMEGAAQRFEVLRELNVSSRLRAVTDELLSLVGHLKPEAPEGGLLN
ncbi:MAG: LON peptidase substrate-binding domain-containing protein [Archangium sp.]|nr:LON peptidase substrate-binding domain-containing protein [Archangium sp.]